MRHPPACDDSAAVATTGSHNGAAEPLRILSLGAGVQSSTLLLMALAGELPRLDAAIFADTGWEPKAVYQHLYRLEHAAEAAGLAVHRVSAGNLRHDALDPTHRFASLPLHVRRLDGGRGLMRRQCTREYKITPIRRKVRALWEQAGRPPVEQWMGISRDEAHRMRSSDVAYIALRYPLVELAMTRSDCHRWLEAHGWPGVPRSACIGCPFRSDERWRQLRDSDPEEWADAVAFDRDIRNGHVRLGKPALRGQVDLPRRRDNDADAATDGFGNDCHGVCGT